tara:strand:+ start:574 stop:1119 length:546 start_codon:yes stop_codon:yes gene_type:complete
MNAFETAWGIVKMPIVPNSLRRVGDKFHADFEDPKTNDTMRMTATPNSEYFDDRIEDATRMLVEIHHPNPDEYELGRLALNNGSMSIHTTGEQRKGGQSFWPYHSFVPHQYRRRGVGKAMYDMAAVILNEYMKRPLTPSNSLSDDAAAFWTNALGEHPQSVWNRRDEPSWPVRDDLWRDEP